MALFDSESIYIESQTTKKNKIIAIDKIIDALLMTAAKAAAGESISEYSLDDGQTKIRTVRRTSKEIMASIAAFQSLKQAYINEINGRVFRLVDAKNFNQLNYGRR
jgi:hypothetical protein